MLLALSFGTSQQPLLWVSVVSVLLSLAGFLNALSASMTIWKRRRLKTRPTSVGLRALLRRRALSSDLSAPALAAERKFQ